MKKQIVEKPLYVPLWTIIEVYPKKVSEKNVIGYRGICHLFLMIVDIFNFIRYLSDTNPIRLPTTGSFGRRAGDR
ncbi:hypothetical protein [Treponema putidum]|uniref:Transposase n=1 Tax=Treponema putidum TaxID=221027 RepID=A0ABY5HW34_9SPIR|nr:hypothetical protein [Treponema putidum]UTY29245.1 hypothetical protein E4N76_09915 [Treponema putidum]